jgi:hypothetical protein
MRQAVQQSVEQALLADTHAQHYTKRGQQATLFKAKKPLEKKIEAKVEGKLGELKRELEMLRAAKVQVPPPVVIVQPEPSTVEGEEDDAGTELGEEGSTTVPPNTW